jgi:hypothetical protein
LRLWMKFSRELSRDIRNGLQARTAVRFDSHVIPQCAS